MLKKLIFYWIASYQISSSVIDTWVLHNTSLAFLNQSYLRGTCTPNQNWVHFVHLLKILDTVLKSNVSIMKQIVW